MKYFIDTEFKEYFKQHRILGIPVGYKTPTIDLISIGIVCENGNAFYRLNKDCDLKEVWKDEWLRENVLFSIYQTSISGDTRNHVDFSYSGMKWIFKIYGLHRNMLAYEVSDFIYRNNFNIRPDTCGNFDEIIKHNPIEFYGYYADYDWVVFCQLFGRMLDLPKGFPMYLKDIKQMYDEKALSMSSMELSKLSCPSCTHNQYTFLEKTSTNYQIAVLKDAKDYPKQEKEHNALEDAKWNYELYKFLQTI